MKPITSAHPAQFVNCANVHETHNKIKKKA